MTAPIGCQKLAEKLILPTYCCDKLLPKYNDLIEAAWDEHDEGSGMDVLYCRMKRVREGLKKLNAAEFSNISSRVAEKRIEYEGLNCKILNGDLRSDILARAAYVEAEYNRLCKAEFQLFQSKSRVRWF
ncbi:hypothetical protein LIER_06602 [Lithospermum erythrorhizon]|uniref:Uncharacterized protein n=1 Tax=Lithospermum erythrorhizon TaxID=34254 RepID=A0AAV3P684_LITER